MASRKRLRAYLSGGMEHARNAGADWRRDVERFLRSEFGHDVFNPNTESDRFLGRLGVIKTFRRMKTADLGRYTRIVRDIVRYDSDAIVNDCDYVICLWNRSAERGAGTKGEITLAKYFRKPVFLVTHRRPQLIPGWVLGCATVIVRDMNALRSVLHFYFNPRRQSYARQSDAKRLPTHRRRSGGRTRSGSGRRRLTRRR